MSQAPASASSLVRVTVASGTRRVDLVVPGAVPVAELLPELARAVGMLDPHAVHAGYRLTTESGRPLTPELGLVGQGVEDGGLLTVTAGVGHEPPRLYDDVVEAMADVVERDFEPWRPEARRRTALGAASCLLALGAAALLVQRGSPLAAVAAVVVAAVLLAGAVVLSRAQREPAAAVVAAWAGAAHATVAGLLLAPGDPLLGGAAAAAGGGALAAGLLAFLGLGKARALALPPVIAGAVLLVAGLVVEATGLDAPVVLTVALVLVVLAGSAFPWLALGVAGTTAQQLGTTTDVTTGPAGVDLAKLAADVRVAHEVLLAISTTVGVLLVLVAPFAVSLGPAGTLLVVAACVVVMLRTRQHRTGSQVLVGLVSGIAGLAAAGAAVLLLWPEWRPAAAVVLAAAGGLVLTTTVPSAPSVWRLWIGDVAESVALLALLPLLVVASGLSSAVGG